MTNIHDRVGRNPVAILDHDAVVAVLSHHFPAAGHAAVRQAADDVLLLELLARDIGVVWEDAMRDDVNAAQVFDGLRPRES